MADTGVPTTYQAFAADVDGDGLTDVVVPDYYESAISVLRSFADGGFAPADAFTVNCDQSQTSFAGLATLTVRDFNGDGLPDLVIGCDGEFTSSGIIAVRLNDGTGHFPTQTSLLAVNHSPDFVAVADFNSDGLADLLEIGSRVTPGDSEGMIHLRNTDGGFHDGVPFRFTFASNFDVRDFDGDGIPDFMVVGLPAYGANIERGEGDGSFTLLPLPTGIEVYGPVRSGDLDGDGRPDLVSWESGADGGDQLHVAHQEDDGGYTLWPQQAVGGRVVAFTDVDGDGRTDVVAVIDQQTTTLLSQGDGTFAPAQSLGMVADWALAVDTDGDAHPDLILGQLEDPKLARLPGLAGGTVQAPLTVTMPSKPQTLHVLDLDHDGLLDLVGLTPAGVVARLGRADGSFAPEVTYPLLGQWGYTRFMDVTGDGLPDLVTTDQQSVNTYVNTGAGFVAMPVATALPGVLSFIDGDLDCDGQRDLVAEVSGSSYVTQVLHGNGDGTFRAGATMPELYDAYLADVTGDGALDLLVDDPGNGFNVLAGRGDGTFAAARAVAATLRIQSVQDLDGDGLADVLTFSPYGQHTAVQTLLNRGQGQFTAGVLQTLTEADGTLVTGDLGGDGRIDAVLVGSSTLQTLTGIGTGFTLGPVVAVAGLAPLGLYDLDHDGKLDLVSYDGLTGVLLVSRGH